MDPERPRTAHTRAELIAAYRASDMHARMLAQAKASADKMNAEKKTRQVRFCACACACVSLSARRTFNSAL